MAARLPSDDGKVRPEISCRGLAKGGNRSGLPAGRGPRFRRSGDTARFVTCESLCWPAASVPPGSCAACGRPRRAPTSPSSATPATTSRCSACTSARTWTPSCTRLGGGISEEQGWGRGDETFTVLAELAAYGAGPGWFSLGDRDLATHIVRTQHAAPTACRCPRSPRALCERWQPGVTLLPMTDDRVQTHVVIDDGDGASAPSISRNGGSRCTRRSRPQIIAAGAEQRRAGARRAASHRGRRLRPAAAVQPGGEHRHHPGGPRHRRGGAAPRPVVGVSPIIGGAPVRGMADACLAAIGVQTTAAAVAAHYGAGLLDGWLVDEQDKPAPSTRRSWPASRSARSRCT